MAISRTRLAGLIVGLIVAVLLIGGGVFMFADRGGEEPSPVDPAEVMRNIPDAEVMWFSQPENVKEQICAGLATDPDAYYELMKQTWLEDADMDPALFGALMTTVIDQCGL